MIGGSEAAAACVIFDVTIEPDMIPQGCETPCLTSIGPGYITDDGHRRVRAGSAYIAAHRLAYLRANGEIPGGMLVHHECENKLCVNPEHLEALTRSEHMRRHTQILDAQAVAAAQRRAATHCKHGHLWEPPNMYRDARGRRRCRACIYNSNHGGRRG